MGLDDTGNLVVILSLFVEDGDTGVALESVDDKRSLVQCRWYACYEIYIIHEQYLRRKRNMRTLPTITFISVYRMISHLKRFLCVFV